MQFVYLLRAGTDHYKVGVATNVRNRIHNLQTSNPQLIELVTARLCANAYDVEKQLHQSLIAMKTNGGTEWFKLKPEDAIELAIRINRFPDIDVSDKVTIQQVLEVQRAMAKSIQKQLDYVINTYQKPVRDNSTTTSAATDLDEPSDLRAAKTEQTALAAFHDLVDRATIIIETEGKASTSLLQRRMSIGYGKAARILDELEKRGVVGPLDGIHREILHIPSLKAVRAAQSAIDI